MRSIRGGPGGPWQQQARTCPASAADEADASSMCCHSTELRPCQRTSPATPFACQCGQGRTPSARRSTRGAGRWPPPAQAAPQWQPPAWQRLPAAARPPSLRWCCTPAPVPGSASQASRRWHVHAFDQSACLCPRAKRLPRPRLCPACRAHQRCGLSNKAVPLGGEGGLGRSLRSLDGRAAGKGRAWTTLY